MFRYFSLLSTHLAVFITTTRWHGSPSPGLLEPGGGEGRATSDLRCSGRVVAIVPGNPGHFEWFSRAGKQFDVKWRLQQTAGHPEGGRLLNSLQRRASSRHCGLPGRPAYRRRPAGLRLDRVDQP